MKAIMDVDRKPKPAFFAYRNALAPLMVSMRTDRFAWQSGGTGEVELWVCNDLNDVPAGTRLGYEVLVDGKIIARQLMEANIGINEPRYQGTLSIPLPKLKQRASAMVRVGLFDAHGNAIHTNVKQWPVFPVSEPIRPAAYHFDNDALAGQLMEESGSIKAGSLKVAKTLYIATFSVYEQHRMEVDEFVKAGGTVLFSELPQGRYRIDGTDVEVTKTIMGEYYFANPEPRLMSKSGLLDKDLFMWYDRKVGYVQPLLRNVFRAEGWQSLVSTGLCNFGGNDPAGYLAAAQRRSGRGRFVICEVTLAGRIKENPAAQHLLKALVSDTRMDEK
jgi:hypothetical protein